MFGVGVIGTMGLTAPVGGLIPAGAIVVSADAYAGILAGNDTTGAGTVLSPYATLAKALTVVAEGGIIMLNGNPASPSIYTAATFFSITKGITIDAIYNQGAYLRGTGAQTRVVNVAPTAGQTVILGKLVVDAQNSIGSCILVIDQATTFTLRLRGTAVTGWTTQGVASTAAAATTKVNLIIEDAVLAGVSTRSAVYFKGLIAGGVTIRRTQITVSNQNASGHGGVIVWAKATGCQFEFTDSACNLTLDNVVGTSTTYGVQVQNIPGANIQRNSFYLDGLNQVGSRPIEAIQVVATAAAPLDSSNPIIKGNTIQHLANGGMGIEIGEDNQDSGSRGFNNGGLVEDNRVICNDFSKAGTTHGIFNGSGGNTIMRRNLLYNTGIAIGDKEGDGARSYSNVIIDAGNSYLRLKGAKNAKHTHNTMVKTVTATSTPILVTNNSTNGHVGSGCVVSGNILYSDVATPYVSAEAAEAVTMDHNDYFCSVAPAATPWSWGGTTYASLALWQAAHEATAFSANPGFVDPGNSNYDVTNAALNVVPADAGVVLDFLSRSFASPASAGAYQKQ